MSLFRKNFVWPTFFIMHFFIINCKVLLFLKNPPFFGSIFFILSNFDGIYFFSSYFRGQLFRAAFFWWPNLTEPNPFFFRPLRSPRKNRFLLILYFHFYFHEFQFLNYTFLDFSQKGFNLEYHLQGFKRYLRALPFFKRSFAGLYLHVTW